MPDSFLKIEAVIQSSRLEQVKAVLRRFSVERLFVSAVAQEGRQGATSLAKLEIVVDQNDSDEIVSAILAAVRPAPPIPNGNIIFTPVASMVRIRSHSQRSVTVGVPR